MIASTRSALEGMNPWWSGDSRQAPDAMPYHRNAFSELRQAVFADSVSQPRAVLLTGMRQVGKTEIARQLLADALAREPRFSGTQVAFVKVDDPRLEGSISLADVLEAWSPFRDTRKPALLIVDEVQKLRDKHDERDHAWAHQLKGAVDTGEFIIFATGSEALELGAGAAEGPGRWARHELEPLSFREFREIGLRDKASVVPSARFVDLERYLVAGGFPQNALYPDESRSCLERTKSYAQEVLDGNAGVRNRHALKALFSVLMAESSEELNVDRLREQLGGTRPTIENWISLMEESFLLRRLWRYDSSLRRELRANPKIHGNDPGLVAALSPEPDPLGHARTKARLFEAAIFRHLREIERRSGGRLRYLQEVRGKRKRTEVDFSLETSQEVFLVEVTTGDSPREKAQSVHAVARRLAGDTKTREGVKGKQLYGLVIHGGAARHSLEVPCIPMADALEALSNPRVGDPCSSLRESSGEVTP